MFSRSLKLSTPRAVVIVRYGDRASVVVSNWNLTSASIGASSASTASWLSSMRLSRSSICHLESGVQATVDSFFSE
jgi:hypothetical protein